MAERKWTPGPWRFDTKEEWPGAIESEGGDDVLYGCGCCGSPNLHRNDAHLIAAAPDLYEALARMVQDVPFGDEPEFALNALSKARGEK